MLCNSFYRQTKPKPQISFLKTLALPSWFGIQGQHKVICRLGVSTQTKYLVNCMTSLWFQVFISKSLQPINHHHERVFIKSSCSVHLLGYRISVCIFIAQEKSGNWPNWIWDVPRIWDLKAKIFLCTRFPVICTWLFSSYLGDIHFLGKER